MTPKLPSQRITRSISGIRKLVSGHPHVSLALATVLVFGGVKILLTITARHPDFRVVIFAAACIAALSLRNLRTQDLPRATRLVFRGIMLLFSLYLLYASPSVVLDTLPTVLILELAAYQWLAPILGIYSLWRLSWAFPLLIAVLWQKAAMSNVLEITISVTDYMPVLEFGMMLTLGAFVYFTLLKRSPVWRSETPGNGLHVMDVVMLTAVAAHFSNYLYSGLQKIFISDPWWQWAADNPTYYLTLAAWEAGALPLTIFNEAVIGTILQYQIGLNVPLNVSILMLQLAAIVAITRISWAAVTTLLYDVTHVVIFLVSGIFFYKWILLNLLITVALAILPQQRIANDVKLWLIGVIIFAPLIFFVAFLGWFDTPSFNDEYLEAVTDNGASYRVPTNYLLSGSITYAQQRLIRNKPGHFSTDAFGSFQGKALTPQSLDKANTCLLGDSTGSAIAGAPDRAKVNRLVRQHHRYVLANLDEHGIINYDLFPHHIFSMPWQFTAFHNLDKRRITSYRYVAESKCLKFDNGKAAAVTLLRGEFDVPLQ